MLRGAAGERPAQTAAETAAAPENEIKAQITRLREEMFSAVNAEEYERAAQLRDQIRLLEGEGGEAQ